MSNARTVTIYRERYTVEDDGNGGSMAVGTETITEAYPCEGTRLPGFTESPAREAAGIMTREYLRYGADGGDWFGREESSVIDYATGEEERVTAHLSGFTATEEAAVTRMVDWIDRRNAETAREYASRF